MDHCWVNCPEKIIQKFNIENSASDHNIVDVILRVKGAVRSNLEFRKRKWCNFDQDVYNERIKNIKWDKMYQMSNVNLAWNYFETSMNKILEEVAPTVKVQPSGRYKTWIKTSNKFDIEERDKLRTEAKSTGSADAWSSYRKMRNIVVKVKKGQKGVLQCKV